MPLSFSFGLKNYFSFSFQFGAGSGARDPVQDHVTPPLRKPEVSKPCLPIIISKSEGYLLSNANSPRSRKRSLDHSSPVLQISLSTGYSMTPTRKAMVREIP